MGTAIARRIADELTRLATASTLPITSKPKADPDCGIGWAGCPPTAFSRTRQSSTATSRQCPNATV
jgi:hypothetical protein